MRLSEFQLLADENIPHAVVEYLKSQKLNVIELDTVLPKGTDDEDIIDFAQKDGRVVITQDMGFGKSQFTKYPKRVGIIYITPGHVGPDIMIEILKHLLDQSFEIEIPFVIVAEKKDEYIKVRARNLFYQ